MVANFDRLGVQVTLAGSNVGGATGSYVDGELNGQTIIVTAGTGGSFQVGPDDGINNRIEVNIDDMRASGPRLNLNTTSVATLLSARGSIAQIDQAIDKVSRQRGDLGAFMNRLAFTISFTENSIENIQNSESSISDATSPKKSLNSQERRCCPRPPRLCWPKPTPCLNRPLALLQ